MKRIGVIVCILTIATVLSCERERPAVKTDPDASAVKAASAAIFLTGDELGEMKPCGCSGGQLGGLDRRRAVWTDVAPASRMVLDTGRLVAGDGEQDMIKLSLIVEAYAMLGYDAVNLTAEDFERMHNQGLMDSAAAGFKLISAETPPPAALSRSLRKVLQVSGKPVPVTVAAFNTMRQGAEEIGALFPGGITDDGIEILLINRCDPGVLNEIRGQWPGLDCIVCRSDIDEPQVLAQQRPLAISLGHFGRYVSRLDIEDTPTGPRLRYAKVPVREELPQDKQQIELYRTYQLLVKEANLLERAPRMPEPHGLKFLGSKACEPCHKYSYGLWSTKPHANAMASLVKVGSQYDPECVVCHVVAMKYEGGYVNEEQTPRLNHVGCENCHGPGSAHVSDPSSVKTVGDATAVCKTCHTPEKSTGYAGHEAEYMQKIVHWPEP